MNNGFRYPFWATFFRISFITNRSDAMRMGGKSEGARISATCSGNALFLHGGPGLTAAMERRWYRSRLPIQWWDQPKANCFAALVGAAASELEFLAELGPVHVIAHSFAGQIVCALADAHPERISRVTLLGCPFDPGLGSVRACRTVAAGGNRALALAADRIERSPTAEAFRNMVDAAVADPSFLRVYFGRRSQAALGRFLESAPELFSLDIETYCSVMTEFLGGPAPAKESAYRGSVRFILGRYDVVLAPDEDIAAWRQVFPQMSVCWVDTGHFLHLEAEPDEWFADEPGVRCGA